MNIFWKIVKAFLKLSKLAGKKVVIQGDSITAGYAASDNAHRYSSLFCALVGATEVNQGLSSKTLQTGNATSCGFVNFDIDSIPVWDSTYGLYILSLGVNDIYCFNGVYTIVGFKEKMNEVIDALISKGWKKNQILILSPHYIDVDHSNNTGNGCGIAPFTTQRCQDYFDAGLEVAKQRHVLHKDIRKALTRTGNPNSYLIDGIHPANAGMQLVAECMAEDEVIYAK